MDFALVYVEAEDGHLYFRRFFADGTPAGPKVVVSPLQNSTDALWRTGLVRNGIGYAVAWVGIAAPGQTTIYFCLLDLNGNHATPDVEVSISGGVATVRRDVALAWSGSSYAVVWAESVAGAGFDLFATLLDGDGNISGSGALHDLVLASAPDDQNHAALAWSPAMLQFCAVWEDSREGYIELRSRLLNREGPVGQRPSDRTRRSLSQPCGNPDRARNGLDECALRQPRNFLRSAYPVGDDSGDRCASDQRSGILWISTDRLYGCGIRRLLGGPEDRRILYLVPTRRR